MHPKSGKTGGALPKSSPITKSERILESATDGIVMLDKEGRYIYANAAAERILGVHRDLILQRTYDQAEWKLSTVKGDPLPDEKTPFRSVMQGNKGVYGLELVVERSDGERIVTSTNAAPLYDASGNFDGVVGIITDITEQHELQERVYAFHHSVAHDLRGPLTVIQGHAEMLREALRKGKVGGTILQNIEGILDCAEKMNRMIEDLVDTARVEGGHVHLKMESIQLEAFVWALLQSAKESIEVNRLATRIPQNLPCIWADPDRLERIFLNLLSNALKFSPTHSKVIIQAQKAGGEIVISITDQGKGITPENCSRLFKRFFQVKGLQASGGVGLGLYISRLLVQAHGGRIWVESKVGEGTTFYFTIPVEAEDLSHGKDR